jgi:hypothetical protein
VSCACELILLFYLVLYVRVVSTVHTFDFKLCCEVNT